MNNFVKICKGGNLILIKEIWNDVTSKNDLTTTDISDISFKYLFNYCIFEENLTLKDIFLLIKKNLDIYDNIIINNYCSEYIQEGFSQENIAIDPDTKINKLVLSWDITVIKDIEEPKNYLYGINFPEFFGKGYINKDTSSEVEISVCLMHIKNIIDLPIVLNKETNLLKEDPLSNKIITLETIQESQYTLLQILYAIFWELSYHGGPEDKKSLRNNLFSMWDNFKKANPN